LSKKVKDTRLVKQVALRLQNLRQERGLTLEKLAFEADMELTQVHRVLNGTHDPQLTTLDKVAKALGTNLSELLTGL
jgi:transcriptional regulator with XRE-family HTH domain